MIDYGLAGKVAVITGAARGQGRSHAVRLAQEGVDIIAIDVCRQIDAVPYELASREELDETLRLVEEAGGKAVGFEADVRNRDALNKAVADGVEALGGRLDIVLANAGIAPHDANEHGDSAVFNAVIDINLVGTWNTIHACTPIMLDSGKPGSIVLTSSIQGLKGVGSDGSGGAQGYIASKHGVVGLMRAAAYWLAPHEIRVNSVHPTGVNTPMVVGNEAIGRWLEASGGGDVIANLLPVEMIEPGDVSDAILWLVSDAARYVTGTCLPIDAGVLLR